MKKIILSILVLASAIVLNAQDVNPRFLKYAIAETGCSAYFPSDPGKFECEKSEDGLNIYVAESTFGNTNYYIVMVALQDTYKDATKEELESLAISYMDYLKGPFGITKAAGCGKGHSLESNPNAIGVLDYWEDNEGYNYSVKAWSDTHILAVMIVYSKDEINFNYQNLFLNGFRFKD